jgi:hypothetical protein
VVHTYYFFFRGRSGNNILSRGDRGPLVFLDNGQAFWRTPNVDVPSAVKVSVSSFLVERSFAHIIGTPSKQSDSSSSSSSSSSLICKFSNQTVANFRRFWDEHSGDLSAALIRSIRAIDPLSEEVLSFFTSHHFEELNFRFERMQKHMERCSTFS